MSRRIERSRSSLSDWIGRVDDRFMGSPIDIDPHEALLWAIRITAGEAAYCEAQISKLYEMELFEVPTHQTLTRMPSGSFQLVEEKRDPEVMSRWVIWRDRALERMARYSKMAIDAGIDERRVAVAERVADLLVPLLEDLAEDLDLTAKQRARLPGMIGKRLKQLEAENDTPVQNGRKARVNGSYR